MADKRAPGEVTTAAQALEEALLAFERTAAGASRIPLSSQRNLQKAAQAITEAAGHQPAIGEGIQQMLAALNAARDRNARTAEELAAFGERVATRSQECTALLVRFGELGEQARELSEGMRDLSGPEAAQLASAEKLARLGPVEQKMSGLVDDAGALAKDAREADFGEVGQQAEQLRQQMQAARNKVMLLVRKLETPGS
jgi:hypothetical protein